MLSGIRSTRDSFAHRMLLHRILSSLVAVMMLLGLLNRHRSTASTPEVKLSRHEKYLDKTGTQWFGWVILIQELKVFATQICKLKKSKIITNHHFKQSKIVTSMDFLVVIS